MPVIRRTPRRAPGQFAARFRGVPAHKLAQAMNRLTPGINWAGCPKGWMAERWATPMQSHRELAGVSLDDIERELQSISQQG